jgi:hypothetical protein
MVARRESAHLDCKLRAASQGAAAFVRAIRQRHNAAPSSPPASMSSGSRRLKSSPVIIAHWHWRNLSAFDQLASRLKAAEPPAVTAALWGIDFRLLDTSQWERALGAALAEPEAPIPDIAPTEPPVIAIKSPSPQIPEEGRLRILAERNARQRARGEFSAPLPPDVRIMTPISRTPAEDPRKQRVNGPTFRGPEEFCQGAA